MPCDPVKIAFGNSRPPAPSRWLLATACLVLGGCRTAQDFRKEADQVAYDLVARAQDHALGRSEPFTIEPPERTLRRQLLLDQNLPYSHEASLGSADAPRIPQWPDESYFTDRAKGQADPRTRQEAPLTLSLIEALQIGAANSRDYQRQKESVFRAALALDLEADDFRSTWLGTVDTLLSSDLSGPEAVNGIEHTDVLSVSRRFKSGLRFVGLVAVDLVKLLTQDRSETLGLTVDASVSIPLLRGAGRFVVTEPLTQAQRNMVYAIFSFERFKRTFAVRVASDYLGVLQQLDQVANAEESYRRVVTSTRRAHRLADAGRLPEIQVDQARQDELRARNRWISAQQNYERRLDGFKLLLGLPTDARLDLDRGELEHLVRARRFAKFLDTAPPDSPTRDQVLSADDPVVLVPPRRADAGPFELEEADAIHLALAHRLDLRTAISQILDDQRGVAVAADDLRPDLTLLGTATFGESRSLASADQQSAQLRPERGRYAALLGLDLALERTAERNRYRNQFIELEDAVRSMQELEDVVKLEVRDALRDLLESRETLRIQAEAVAVARRRVDSTDLFLQAGRAEIRDVLEANEDLNTAQNALTAALVNYRVAELRLQRDLGVLQVDEKGLWQEYLLEDSDDADT